MNSYISNDQKRRFHSFLAHQRTCILSTGTAIGVWATPVYYRCLPWNSGRARPQVDCLVPTWSDVAHQLTQVSQVLLLVQALTGAGLSWLQILGAAQPLEEPEWQRLLPRWIITNQPELLYLVTRVTPDRIELIDEERGWGVQESLEW